MGEYIIKQIDVESPPNEWKGPRGTVWYISVMLEGHDKPVSIGKKTPDALKVGDTAYGDIIETEFSSDKWKHGEKPEGEQINRRVSNSSTEKPDYEPSTNTRWAIGMAYRAFVQVTNSPEGADGNFPFDAVKQHARGLLDMFEELRNGGSGEVTIASPSPAIKDSEKSATAYDKFKAAGKSVKKDEPEDWTQGLEEEYGG